MRDTTPTPDLEQIRDTFADDLKARTEAIEEPQPLTPTEFANWIGDQLQDDLDSKQYAVVESSGGTSVMLLMRRNGFSYPITIGEPYQ